MITVDQLLDYLGKHAHRVLIEEKQGSLLPIYHLIPEKGPGLVVGCPWKDTEEKLAAVRQIKRIARQRKAVMVGFVSEAWTVIYPRGKLPQVVDPPSESPMRVEVVIATATDGEVVKTASWLMIRSHPGGTLVSLRPQTVEPVTEVSNRLLDGILPPRKRKP